MMKDILTNKLKNISFKKPTKVQYILGFAVVVLLLAGIKRLAGIGEGEAQPLENSEELTAATEETFNDPRNATLSKRECSMFNDKKHRILSVPNYKVAFPDSQSVQIVAANKWGVKPVKNREDAEARKKELVYVGESPYYHVDKLKSSIPYLVPRAAVLLQDIGQAFYDSLYMKGVPLNQLIVTSVLRTQEDVQKLQRHNGNATDNSCHLYGTTFDICYNRYHAVGREVRNDTLKWVLSEVLRDMREDQRCYIKYEVKQGCFHMTVR